jgi:hypothetical protein
MTASIRHQKNRRTCGMPGLITRRGGRLIEPQAQRKLAEASQFARRNGGYQGEPEWLEKYKESHVCSSTSTRVAYSGCFEESLANRVQRSIIVEQDQKITPTQIVLVKTTVRRALDRALNRGA